MKLRVLVVDDDAQNRSRVHAALRDMGMALIDHAEDGDSALKALDRADYDLLITDWQMPGIDGLALIQRLRAESRWRQLPILMLSAIATRDRIEQACLAGANDYLIKPFTAAALSEKVNHLMVHDHDGLIK